MLFLNLMVLILFLLVMFSSVYVLFTFGFVFVCGRVKLCANLVFGICCWYFLFFSWFLVIDNNQ